MTTHTMKLTNVVILLVCSLAVLIRGEKYNSQTRFTSDLPPLIRRANQTLQGLFHYYWEQDQGGTDQNIKFFFVCGQIGEGSDGCYCSTTKPCLECYRWWDAVALESIASFGILTNSTLYADTADIFYTYAPYNAQFNAAKKCTYIDDFAWYAIAYLRVYEWLKDPKWLQRSVALHKWAWDYGWDDDCGGFWWTNCPTQFFKDSITILENLYHSSKLAYLLPKETQYLENAIQIWDWFFSFDNGYGIMSDKYLVSTGVVPELCCNSTTTDPLKKCTNSRISGTSYNQGLLLSSSAYLYVRTRNSSYLNVGLRALEAILTNYTTEEGLLVDEPRGYRTYEGSCFWGGDPGGDWYSFQGIFMLHLSYFTDVLVKNSNTLNSETLSRIMKLVQLSSDSAWTKSALWPPFKINDACNLHVSKSNVSVPKFYWWWGKNSTLQKIPPDTRLYFQALQVHCQWTDKSSLIWTGSVADEFACMDKCSANASCSKYLFKTLQGKSGSINCWLWSYSHRLDPSCLKSNANFNVGVKRPYGDTTCAGKCNSTDPIKQPYGVCYCDSECESRLDCCIDYAKLCIPDKVLTCKGMCNSLQPYAIPGGGYCWCQAGCVGGYTDNNSYSSCCPDYSELCYNVAMPECLDARSQGSALNLFVAHLSLLQTLQGGQHHTEMPD